jgi:hypothetical protein
MIHHALHSALALVAFVAGCGGQRSPSALAGPDASSDASRAGEVPQHHRAAVTTCAPSPPAPEPQPSDVTFGQCMKNEDCIGGKNGRCVGSLVHGGLCAYDTCAVDSDCVRVGLRVCACEANNGLNMCAGGNSTVDADCGAGGFCSPSPGDSYGSLTGYFCHAPSDACINDSDCTQAPGDECGYRSGAWTCFSPGGD